ALEHDGFMTFNSQYTRLRVSFNDCATFSFEDLVKRKTNNKGVGGNNGQSPGIAEDRLHDK
ncbi:MAG: hypothetical protein PVH60_00260, partial [Anaerolineales bacterium]